MLLPCERGLRGGGAQVGLRFLSRKGKKKKKHTLGMTRGRVLRLNLDPVFFFVVAVRLQFYLLSVCACMSPCGFHACFQSVHVCVYVDVCLSVCRACISACFLAASLYFFREHPVCICRSCCICNRYNIYVHIPTNVCMYVRMYELYLCLCLYMRRWSCPKAFLSVRRPRF
jgi:hypothetical protein